MSIESTSCPEPALANERLAIVWEGPQVGLHSFAQVNRELCRRLGERGHEIVLAPSRIPPAESRTPPGQEGIAVNSREAARGPIAAHVRHQWPPNFTHPPAGHWVMMQPWEFGSLPRSWIGPLSHEVDDCWAYSRFVRDCYIQSGIPADRVHVDTAGGRLLTVSSPGEALSAQDDEAVQIPVRRGHDSPERDRRALEGLPAHVYRP